MISPELNPYQNYLGRPKIFNAVEAISDGIINPLHDGKVAYKPEGEREMILAMEDLVEPTFEGLLERLVPGTRLSNELFEEYPRISEAVISDCPYGVYAFYPTDGIIKRFMPKSWQRLSLVVSNGQLFNNPKGTLEWTEVRQVLENTVVAQAGCSVGNHAIHCAVSNLRPNQVKVADPKVYHVANANRVRLQTGDIRKNKAIVTTEQLHGFDPWMEISVYQEGIHEGNIDDFVGGNKAIGEPKATVVIEETDDPDAKIAIRQIARKHQVPVLMVTDAGPTIQRDIRRFDLHPNASLAVGVPDELLYAAKERAEADPGNLEKFIDFACALVGDEHLTGTFKNIVLQRIEVIFCGIPQLHSTTAAAGGVAGEAISSLALGHPLHERILINIRTAETLQSGELI